MTARKWTGRLLGVLAAACVAAAQPARAGEVARQLQNEFIAVAKKVNPSVVNVRTVRKEVMGSGEFHFGPGDPDGNLDRFREFFHDFFGPGETPGPERGEREFSSSGSGVIVDARGHILTNNHVVEGAEKIQVKLEDGRELDARVIGSDSLSDLAVLKVESSEPLQAIEAGSSESLEVGQWALAIGNPFGLEHTVTTGIISAKNRSIDSINRTQDFIQTDAAINPGNSGGALVDLDGKLIGINTAIFTQSGGNVGIGFAIPVDSALGVMRQLVEKGRVTRGWLGIQIQDVDDGLAVKFGVKQGVLVARLLDDDSPAAKAGVKHGDVIVEFDGKPVKTARELSRIVADSAVKGDVKVKIIRDGKPLELQIVVGERPDLETRTSAGGGGGTPDEAERLGLELEDLPADAKPPSEDGVEGGVLVRKVLPGGKADHRNGVAPGDIIVELEGKPTPNLRGLREALKEIGDESVLLVRVFRSGSPLYLVIGEEKEAE